MSLCGAGVCWHAYRGLCGLHVRGLVCDKCQIDLILYVKYLLLIEGIYFNYNELLFYPALAGY